jgi:hypothetical protein
MAMDNFAENVRDKSPPVTDPEVLAAALAGLGTMSPRLRKLYDDAAAMLRASAKRREPIGWLCRTKQQVIDAEKAFPGEPHDYLWKYTHGTKDMERFAAFPDLDVMPVYAAPKPTNGLTVQADADGVWLAFAASTGRHALLNVERIADSHGGIVSKALRDWAADVGKPRGA